MILKYRNHPSIVIIQNLNKRSRFDFSRVSIQDVVEEVKKRSTRKATQYPDLPVKIIKENSNIFGNCTCNFFSNGGDFPSILNIANITTIFKKEDRDLKDNYRPVSILPVISKVFCINKLRCS